MNYIGRIRRSARLRERQREIEEEVGHFFENLYKGDFKAKPKLEGHSLLFLWMFKDDSKESLRRSR